MFWWPLSLVPSSLASWFHATVITQATRPRSCRKTPKPQSRMLYHCAAWPSSMASWTAKVRTTSWRCHLPRSTTLSSPTVRSITHRGEMVIMEWQWETWSMPSITNSTIPQSSPVCLHQTRPQSCQLRAWKHSRTSGRRIRTATMPRNQSPIILAPGPALPCFTSRSSLTLMDCLIASQQPDTFIPMNAKSTMLSVCCLSSLTLATLRRWWK